MKAYRKIFLATYFLLTIVGITYKLSLNSLEKVSVTYINKEDLVSTVNCTGKVYVEQYGIFSSVSSELNEIYVEEGEKVKENQQIASVKENSNAVAVMAGIESYQNKIFNNYLSAFSKALNDLGVDAIGEEFSLNELNEYYPVIQNKNILTSPIKGTVVSVNTGNDSKLGLEPIAVVADYDNVYINCTVSENNISSIKSGQQAVITGNGFSKKYYGKVIEISKQANASLLQNGNSTVAVKILVHSPKEELLNGLSANCKITTNTDYNVSVLPAQYIFQNDNGEEFVMTYKNGVIEYKTVKCNYITTGKVKVTGLSIDVPIICTDKLLKEGQRVWLNNA